MKDMNEKLYKLAEIIVEARTMSYEQYQTFRTTMLAIKSNFPEGMIEKIIGYIDSTRPLELSGKGVY